MEQVNNTLAKKERLKSLLKSSDLSDCSFVIEDTEIKAHKLILTCSSPVFEKMFYGELSSDRVVISDIATEDFRVMLEFVYTDTVAIKSVQHAWSLFYIADKYLLTDFADVCATFVEKNLCIGNLVLNYELAEMYNLRELQKKCLRDIGDYVKGVFEKNCSDYHMKSTTLVAILQEPALNICNTDLVTGVVHWIVTECELKNGTTDCGNIIKTLVTDHQDIFNILQNLDFEIDDLTCDNVTVSSVMEFIKKSRDPLSGFREYLTKHWCTFCKTRQTYKIARRIELRETDFLLSNISVNRNTFLYGLVLLTEDEQDDSISNTYRGKISIKISQLDSNRSTTNLTHVTKQFPYETHVYIPLKELIFLECDKVYSVRVGYVNLDHVTETGVRKSSVLCNYMSSKLVDEKRKTIFAFDDLYELGSVIKGICYYPA